MKKIKLLLMPAIYRSTIYFVMGFYTFGYLCVAAEIITKDHRFTIYVSTIGNDSFDGLSPSPLRDNIHGPFSTLERARDELRKIKRTEKIVGEVNIVIRAGTYELKNTFQLDTQDSGTLLAPVIYRAFKGEKVILSGGRTLNNCIEANPKIINCDTRNLQLNELMGIGIDMRMNAQLPPFETFINGKRMQLSRWPNSNQNVAGGDTWAYMTNSLGKSSSEFIYNGTLPFHANLSENAVVHIWPGNDWFDQYIDVKKIVLGKFTLSKKTTYPIESGRRFSILNLLETLDQPGEWYYSADKQKLSMIPLPNNKLTLPVVSYLNNIIKIHNAYNIQLKDITIEYSRKTAVIVTGGNNNWISNCIIRNTAGYGISIQDGSHHRITQSEIYDTGDGGIILKGGDRQTLNASVHQAIKNNIHHTGRLVRSGKSAVLLKGVGNIAKLNQIHDTPGIAVTMIGNDHLLELNDIHHTCKENSDCGAVYTGRDWTFYGNLIRNNLIHDIYGYGMVKVNNSTATVDYATPNGARGIYLDDAASGFEVTGNILFRIPGKMLQIGGGRNNIITNNIFITSNYAIWMDARWPGYPWEKVMTPRLDAVPYKGKIWRNRFPKLADPMNNKRWPEGNQITQNIIMAERNSNKTIMPFRYAISPGKVTINNNIVWNNGNSINIEYRNLETKKHGIVNWNEWKDVGLDTNSLVTNPKLIHYEKGNLILSENSDLQNIGFSNKVFEKISKYYNAAEINFNKNSPKLTIHRFNTH